MFYLFIFTSIKHKKTGSKIAIKDYLTGWKKCGKSQGNLTCCRNSEEEEVDPAKDIVEQVKLFAQKENEQ